jgi:8-oxo-dGTP pyrophosphatase MutT (NUDIX family)
LSGVRVICLDVNQRKDSVRRLLIGRGELLLLESPRRPGWWEPVNGAVDDGETLLEAALREVHEERQ